MKGEVKAELLKSRILRYWVLLHYWVNDGNSQIMTQILYRSCIHFIAFRRTYNNV